MKRIITLLGAMSVGLAFAQTGRVGINTENPDATLDVKSKTGTTSATKNLELRNANDTKLVTVLDDGNVGIGTATPTTKLHIDNGTTNGAIRIVDGTQGAGKVLTSDANGVATWKAIQGAATQYTRLAPPNIPARTDLWNGIDTDIPGLGTFTANEKGKYLIIYHSFFYNGGDIGEKSFYFRVFRTPVGGTRGRIVNEETYSSISTRFNSHLSTVVDLNAGDVLDFKVNASIGTTPSSATTPKSLYIEQGAAGARNQVEIIYIGD